MSPARLLGRECFMSSIELQIDGIARERVRRKVGDDLMDIYDRVAAQQRLSFEDGVRLYRSPDLSAVGYLANLVRERLHGDRTYYVRNQHINYPTSVTRDSASSAPSTRRRAAPSHTRWIWRRCAAS